MRIERGRSEREGEEWVVLLIGGKISVTSSFMLSKAVDKDEKEQHRGLLFFKKENYFFLILFF